MVVKLKPGSLRRLRQRAQAGVDRVPFAQVFQSQGLAFTERFLQFEHAEVAYFLGEIEIDPGHFVAQYEMADFFQVITVFFATNHTRAEATFQQNTDRIFATLVRCRELCHRATAFGAINAFEQTPLKRNPDTLKYHGTKGQLLCFKACVWRSFWRCKCFACHVFDFDARGIVIDCSRSYLNIAAPILLSE